jgi:hypothetical protein
MVKVVYFSFSNASRNFRTKTDWFNRDLDQFFEFIKDKDIIVATEGNRLSYYPIPEHPKNCGDIDDCETAKGNFLSLFTMYLVLFDDNKKDYTNMINDIYFKNSDTAILYYELLKDFKFFLKKVNEYYKKLAYSRFEENGFEVVVDAVQRDGDPKSFSNIIFVKRDLEISDYGIDTIDSFEENNIKQFVRFPWIEINKTKLYLFHMTLTFDRESIAYRSWLKQINFVINKSKQGHICVGDANFFSEHLEYIKNLNIYEYINKYAVIGPESNFTFMCMYDDWIPKDSVMEDNIFLEKGDKAKVVSSLDMILSQREILNVKLWNTLGEFKDVTSMSKKEYIEYLMCIINKNNKEDITFWNSMVTDHLLTSFEI